MQQLIPHLWFDNQAEEAANFYTGIFKNSKILSTVRYPKAAEEVSGKKAGSVMTVEFEIISDSLRLTEVPSSSSTSRSPS